MSSLREGNPGHGTPRRLRRPRLLDRHRRSELRPRSCENAGAQQDAPAPQPRCARRKPLRLDGEDLNLARVLVNGAGCSFKMDGETLVLENLPEGH